MFMWICIWANSEENSNQCNQCECFPQSSEFEDSYEENEGQTSQQKVNREQLGLQMWFAPEKPKKKSNEITTQAW